MNRFAASTLGLALLALPISACSAHADDDDRPGVAAQGTGGERRYPVSDFDTVGLAAVGDVDVRVGPAFSVVATGEPATLDKLRIRRDGHTLVLDRKRGVSWGNDKVHFAVSMPRIAGASIGGSGSITVDRVDGGSFEGNIGGSGNLDIRGMKVDKADFAIGGSGNITAAGTARSTEVSIGGSGKVRNAGLASEHAEVTIAGAGNVQASARNTADVTIVGSGDVTITGGAKCSVTKMGSGKVNCG